MVSREIFRHTDSDDDDTTTVIRDRATYIKLSVNGPTSYTFMGPADIVAMHAALGALIEERGWSK